MATEVKTTYSAVVPDADAALVFIAKHIDVLGGDRVSFKGTPIWGDGEKYEVSVSGSRIVPESASTKERP